MRLHDPHDSCVCKFILHMPDVSPTWLPVMHSSIKCRASSMRMTNSPPFVHLVWVDGGDVADLTNYYDVRHVLQWIEMWARLFKILDTLSVCKWEHGLTVRVRCCQYRRSRRDQRVVIKITYKQMQDLSPGSSQPRYSAAWRSQLTALRSGASDHDGYMEKCPGARNPWLCSNLLEYFRLWC